MALAIEAPPAGPQRRHRGGRRGKWLGLALIVAIGSGYHALKQWHDTHALFINASDSLPNWAFLVEAGKFPRRGEYIAFRPGNDPLTLKHFGSTPEPFVKRAYGMPGDVISHRGREVLVNGLPVVRMKPRSRQGETLVPGPVGLVPHNCVFAATTHKDGFDSRYAPIGFVCARQIVGVGVPIL